VNGDGELVLIRIVFVLDLWCFGHFSFLPALGESAFRFWQIDPLFAKFSRPLSQVALALSTFFGRRSRIDHFLDRICGQLLSALPTAELADRFRWRILAPCLCIQKFRSRLPAVSAKSDRIYGRNSDFWATMFRVFGPALQLFRMESERLKLPAPFSRRIAEPLDADAAGQATFYRCFDKIGARRASEMVILTCRTLHFSRAQSCATEVTRPETTSSSHRRPRAMALTRCARRLNCSGRTSLRDALCGSRIWRD
jgi:hypothetical protein